MSSQRGQRYMGGATINNGSETNISPAGTSLEATLQELLQAIRQITPLLRGGAFARLYKEFTVLGGSTFDGKESPIEANDWLYLCERIFEKMQVTELQKRELAVHQLKSTAASWWKATCLGIDEGPITWDEFKRRFEGRFFPPCMRGTLSRKFFDFKQDEAMTVTEYVNRYDELSIHAAGWVQVPSCRTGNFVNGLLPSIQTSVRRDLILDSSDDEAESNFDKALNSALFRERLELGAVGVAAKDKAVKPRRSRDCRFQPYSRSQSSENVRCFTCGKTGHYSYGCPDKGNGSQC